MILLAIGANLPDADGRGPRASCQAAVESLRGMPGLRVQAVSRWYTSAAIPPSGQPPYVNGVARLEGVSPDPALLLGWLQGIEAQAGRVRGAVNAARPLDLDIIDMDGVVRDAPDPVLPHPRAHLRAFVLLPLAEVAPGWVHPRLRLTAEALLARMPDQEIALL